MATLEHTGEWGRSAGSKLGWMIAGRLATALLLSVVGTFWTRTAEASHSINKSLGLLTIVACLTILYAIIFRLSKNILFQARFQLAVDILLVTWLVWNSSVIQSPYLALYIVIIAISSLFLGPREAVVTSVGCAAAFTACSLQITGLAGDIDETRLVSGSISQTVQWVGLFDVAFLVVGLLSARLAERQSRSDVRLMAATQSLANLRALHERIVASIRSGVVTTDLDGRIFTFNVAAQEITGYQEQTIRGKDASILFGEL
jgi:two-component system sensor histidine kinase PilS (NtrC family)